MSITSIRHSPCIDTQVYVVTLLGEIFCDYSKISGSETNYIVVKQQQISFSIRKSFQLQLVHINCEF